MGTGGDVAEGIAAQKPKASEKTHSDSAPRYIELASQPPENNC